MISVKALEGTGPALLDFIFLLVSGNNDTDFEAQRSLEHKLCSFFSSPIYTWELPKKHKVFHHLVAENAQYQRRKGQ